MEKKYPEDKSDHDLVEEAKVIIARRNGRVTLPAIREENMWEELCVLFYEMKQKENSLRSKRQHERMMKAINDIDPKDISKWLAEQESHKASGIARVRKHLSVNAKTDEALDKWFKRFFKWETDIEERAYANGVITVSNFFSALDDLVREEGEEITESFSEDFLSTAYLWRGYTFKTYCGQGCFTRIMKGETHLFQTT